MRKVIPEKQECYCDRCKKRVVDSYDFWVDGNIKVKRKITSNVLGAYYAKNKVFSYVQKELQELDLCEQCTDEFIKFMGW